MKKRALRKDFYMEIRRTMNRFLSIFLITALGVAFFSGVRASKPDMQLSADAFYDESRLMDLRVMGTLGMTQEDLEAIAAIDGVADVMGACVVDMFADLADDRLNVQVMSVPDIMNLMQVQEGRMPETENECLVDYKLITSGKCKLGDSLTLKSGTDTETEDILSEETFTVVGAGSSPYYLSLERGNTSIGNGSLDGFLVIPKEAFSMDYYTQICVTVDGAYELNCYTDEYENLVETVADRIEAIAREQCELRYAGIQQEGKDRIEAAESELADGEQKLEDAGARLEDAKAKLADAEQELADGEKALADGEREAAEKEQELLDAKQEVEDGWKKVNQARGELSQAAGRIQSGYAEYNSKKAELDAGYAQLAPYQEQLEQAQDQLAQIEAGIEQAEAGITQIETAIACMQRYDELRNIAQDQLTDQQNIEKEELEKQIQDQLQLEASGVTGTGWTDQIAALQVQKSTAEAELAKLKEAQESCETGIAQLEPTVTQTRATLDAGAAQLAQAKQELDSASAQVRAGRSATSAAAQELKSAEAEITDGEGKLADGRAELADARKRLADGQAEFADAQEQLADGEAEYEKARLENEDTIADARVKIEDAKEELADLEVPEWYVLDRQYIATFADYGQNADRIGAIGEVFPVIFFLVAALVCLTTMTRMVEEQRTQIGTLKALGYGKGAIASKYLMYALLSSVLGSLFGLVVGQKLLPSVIISAYRILYTNLPDILTPLNFWYSLTAMAAAVFCTTAATWAACYKGLNAVPAQLMRPVAPKAGKRVLLERLTFLWKRLNFSQKATVRNLIRYKKRFFMTIFGIGGCMALLLVGFGLKDSIMYIGTGQFENVFSYDAAIGIDSDSTPEEREELLVKAEQDERILCSMEVLQTAIDIEKDGVEKSAYLVVPQVPEELDSYIHLQDRVTQEAYSLDSDGIILNEKLASVLGIDEGDTVILKEDETSRVEAVVSHITENYFMHYIYMSPELYEELFGKEPEWNVLFTDNVQNDNAFEAAMQEEYMELDAVSGLSFISGTAERVADMLRSMDLIIYVLVIAAGLLAFVVLYNLNNININERKRELATLKVLGFYDGEVSAYVNRENVLLTVLGAAAGVILGIFLHRFVIVTAETDTLMFGRTITAKSYLYSVILTFLFSAAVNGVMFFKLRRIDMVESLKSVE